MLITDAVRRHWNEQKLRMVMNFSTELAEKLQRSRKEILDNGLFATDFNHNVKLTYEDGSTIFYKSAFIIKNETHWGIFTEHCGYHTFFLEEFETVEEHDGEKAILNYHFDEEED